MRTVGAGLFMSVDGVVESPNLWQLDAFDDELGVAMNAMMERTGDVILGATSYREWSEYWPDKGAGDPFAAFINPIRKHVVSRTLTAGDITWENAALADAPLEEFVSSLKQTDGAEISVCGSLSIVRQLLVAGLLDSLQLLVHPVFAGHGRHLFEADDPMTQLTLVDLQRTSKGNVVATYARR